jgi:hypothetical protein
MGMPTERMPDECPFDRVVRNFLNLLRIAGQRPRPILRGMWSRRRRTDANASASRGRVGESDPQLVRPWLKCSGRKLIE